MYRNRRSLEELLFNETDWYSIIEHQRQAMHKEIASKNGDQLLNTSSEDLAKFYADKYAIVVPVLDRENITVDQRESQIDVSHDRMRNIRDRSKPHNITGTAVDVEIPFSGDKGVFFVRPSRYDLNPPRASVNENILSFTIQGTALTVQYVDSAINSKLSSVEQYLGWLEDGAKTFNPTLYEAAYTAVNHRKQKLLADRNLVAGLGFKMKKRSGAEETYASLKVRRNITPPQASTEPCTPEPTLLTSEYEHILSVLENMVRVMEFSPGAFNRMDEESLRTHFLVQLNGQYEGSATGETFNFDGKTDILIKDKGRNIFVGECKFWTGEKAYTETIDQLLGYTSWRDTKAAILVFNRNKDFSAVLEKIFSATPSHPNCKKQIKQISETSWSYLFSQPDDPNREMIITVQVYNIPEHVEPRIRPL